MFQNIRRRIEKLFIEHRKYTDDSWLSQEEIDRVFQIARELER